MRNPDRIDNVLNEIGKIWKMVPDWRFMQLINNIQRATRSDMFYVEDDKLITILNEYAKMLNGEINA